MRIEFITGNNISGSDALTSHIKGVVLNGLVRVGDHLREWKSTSVMRIPAKAAKMISIV